MNKFDVAVLFLRVAFGVSMALHGINKIRGNGLTGTSQWFSSLGYRWPRLQAITASSTEVIAGILMVIGLFHWIACVAFVSLMFVAIVTVHWKVGYFIFLPGGGWEYCASILTVATALGLLGPGSFSLDDSFSMGNSLGVWVLPIGLILGLCHLFISYRPQRESLPS